MLVTVQVRLAIDRLRGESPESRLRQSGEIKRSSKWLKVVEVEQNKVYEN